MTAVNNDESRQVVRGRNGRMAAGDGAGGSCSRGCCGSPTASTDSLSRGMGYSAAEVPDLPPGANLGRGCGKNTKAIAALRHGETVRDLGRWVGFDAFLAARQVGDSGRVIGVDMTPAMVSKARARAEAGGYLNTEFRLGEIEHLPVADGTAVVMIAQCVIDLLPDKPQVFADAYRALNPGEGLAFSGVIAFAELPEEVR